ncbi:hypothetical protein N8I74_04485 [Chitiniphilus purpureus]|uniref:DUF6708 domain-containing protein n=1 Tax=Chitiniphilus purpureus TaxID=2981137 RepID=A0ABY6DRE3_9NEIS|nr:DUF6708 domain-containing protein [Chitiniphilus sp. CD1]UXY16283.1 hypothetical protein N8I74_04485 [Chitiniphilus sp. CD1]
MEYIGLISRYPVNRPLTDDEIIRHLPQDQPSTARPWYQLSVIRMNSTYLECCDKFFGWKGLLTTVAISFGAIMGSGILQFLAIIFLRWGTQSQTEHKEDLIVLAFLAVLAAIFAVALTWLMRHEAFRYTHYPIRFNRKTRMVHVFRLNGSVLTVPWDDIYFTLNRAQMRNTWEVRGHILAEDRLTVLETFGLPYFSEANDPNLLSQWEFVRHYMEKGPAQLLEQVQHTMDIAGRRETFWGGFHRLMVHFNALPLLAWLCSPVFLLLAIGRWIAMRTSKVPAWPPEVEAQSQVDPEDRHQRDAQHPYAPSRGPG